MSPFLPEASWGFLVPRPAGSAQIYLDVSGSMDAEMPHVVALLGALRRWIRMPFWAFSTCVAPARIENGVLKSETTGGTSIECVLRHIAATRPEAAVIVTDGYIERISPAWLKDTAPTRIHAIVTRDGSTRELDRARIACTQLDRLPPAYRSLVPTRMTKPPHPAFGHLLPRWRGERVAEGRVRGASSPDQRRAVGSDEP